MSKCINTLSKHKKFLISHNWPTIYTTDQSFRIPFREDFFHLIHSFETRIAKNSFDLLFVWKSGVNELAQSIAIAIAPEQSHQ